jgi:hypothetical protein
VVRINQQHEQKDGDDTADERRYEQQDETAPSHHRRHDRQEAKHIKLRLEQHAAAQPN